MDSFEATREKAQALRAEALEKLGEQPTAPELAAFFLGRVELDLIHLEEDDALLHQAEAVLDREMGAIYLKRGIGPEEEAALVAHELGHLFLHEGPRTCMPDEVDVSSPDEGSLSAAASVEGYGSRERRELQANVFGRELLLPRSLARDLFLKDRLRAGQIVARLQIPRDIVYQQLCDALLVPRYPAEAPNNNGEKPGLNPQQEAAAEYEGKPLLLEAGPGTGKTRTLVARIVSLVKRGTDPSSILALTFSNKAARELSERVAAEVPQAAASIWTGTFHAFGLEIMRKYYQFFGLEPDVRMFSRTDAIDHLEEILPTLGLVYHQNLYEPALELKEMLSAISRAKDELVDAAGYMKLAQAMVEAAQSDEDLERAERAVEVASVYEVYEASLKELKVVDFGDLIMRPTLLLEGQPAIRAAVRLRHRHVLVDEYQDVNRASARLLKTVSGDGDRLWVVGDSRQSIYRFRGASSANMALFTDDYPNAERMALSINYRSSQEIVGRFAGFSQQMRASRSALVTDIEAHQGSSGHEVDLSEVPDPAGELSAVAARVRRLQVEGVAYRDQAVLCRSNKTLNMFAQALEARGIPVLYFGSLFERDEVRDMMALLSMTADSLGGGLMRVAGFANYGIPLNDVSLFLNRVREKQKEHHQLVALDAMADPTPYAEGISEQGLAGLRKVYEEVGDLPRRKTPWTMLVTYLFDKSDYLRPLLDSDSIADRMRCLALYQLLNFVRGQKAGKGEMPARRLLDKVRMLMLLGEERHLSQIPAPALGLDAVRLMTVHGSKGLEFEAVHIPSMVATAFPMSFRGQRCPPPHGLLTLAEGTDEADPVKDLHEEEEECLFYVALSRAKKHLHLYRSRTGGSRKRSPSKFLGMMVPGACVIEVPDLLDMPELELPSDRVETTEPPPEETRAENLVEYERCPKRYFYARVFGLAGSRKQSAFVKTHRCIYEVIDQVNREPGKQHSVDSVKEMLEASWKGNGPVGHGFEDKYRDLAQRLVGNLVQTQAGLEMVKVEPLKVQLTHGKVVMEPNQLAKTQEGGKVLRIIKTGRKGSFKGEDTIHGLYQLGAQQTYGPGGSAVEVVHLTDRKTTPVSMTDRKCSTRVKKADDYLGEIKRGVFPVNKDPVNCPRCPYFFVCPTVPKGALCQRRDREWPPGDEKPKSES